MKTLNIGDKVIINKDIVSGNVRIKETPEEVGIDLGGTCFEEEGNVTDIYEIGLNESVYEITSYTGVSYINTKNI